MSVVAEAGLQSLGDRVAGERGTGHGIEFAFPEIKLGPFPCIPFCQVLEERTSLRIGLLVLDATHVFLGVVGRTKEDLAKAESVGLDGDERLARAGVADDLIRRRGGAHDVAEVGAIGPAHEVPAQARDVRLEAGGVGEADRLDFLQREGRGEAQRHVIAGEPLLDGFGDRIGRQRRARIGLELRGRLGGRSPFLE